VFERIAAVMVKEVRQLARDRLTFGLIVGIPLMQMLLFGYAINFDVRNLRAAVVDEAGTSLSREYVAALEASGVVVFLQPSAGVPELRRRMSAGEISVGVHIPPDFERRAVDRSRPAAQLLVDGSEPMVDNVARGLAAVPLPRRDGRYGAAAPVLELRTEYNPERRTAVQIVPALIGVILNMTMMIFTAAAIVRERERGNLELLITTPIRSWELMAGKLLPYVGIGLVQVTLVLAVGSLLFDVPVNGRLADLYLAALLFIAATLTLGLVISTLARTQFQAFQLAFFVMLPSILLSGFMFPFDGMPEPARWLAQVLPLTHFNELVRGIVLRGAPIADLGRPALKLLAFLVVALAIATLRFRKSLD
jgi:ABC-2 type transport system permease protein